MRIDTNHYPAQRVLSSQWFIQVDEPSEDGHASIGQFARSYQATNPTGRNPAGPHIVTSHQHPNAGAAKKRANPTGPDHLYI
ncbi:hypothetical protein, partial [Nocardia gipuzkoensis]